jgi:hypothetical protein
MEKLYALALHDLRVSDGRRALGVLEDLRRHFGLPLTVHLVFDQDPQMQPELWHYLRSRADAGNLEIVFHGLTHSCAKNVSRRWAFYHKYQAEYLDDDPGRRAATEKSFTGIVSSLKMNIGICPPCWLATRENSAFLQSLQPLYLERLLSLQCRRTRFVSPVISLGSSRRMEVWGLKILAGALSCIARILRLNRVRIAMHVCDLDLPDSRRFFDKTLRQFARSGYRASLLRELSEDQTGVADSRV